MELFSDMPGDEGLPGPARRLAMIAVMTATTMAVLDGAMVNIALPQIARALAVTPSATVWVANGYLLAVAMTLAIFAALATQVGFRKLFASGLALFTLASLGCALSTSLPMLTAMRILQGVGGAAALSIAPAIHRTIFPNRLLGRILGANALLIAAGTAVGPTLGGTLLAVLSWPWLFAINVPLGVIGVILALRALPRDQAPARKGFDIPGAILSALAMGGIILAADACARLEGSRRTADAPLTAAVCALVAIAAGWAFVRRQRRAPVPLIPLDIFASQRFTLAAATSLASFFGQGITLIALPFLFQSAFHYSAFQSALLFTPWPLGIMIAAPQAGRLADRHPPAMLSTAGLAVLAVGLVCLALMPTHAAAWDIVWRNFVCGIGFGFFQSPNNRELLGNVPRERSGAASGILSIMRTFGQCLGTAAVGVVLSGVADHERAIRICLGLAVAGTLLALGVSFSRIRHAQQPA